MFEDWKLAWQQAVENFQSELSDDDSPGNAPPQIGAMRKDLAAARNALKGLDDEIARCQVEIGEEVEAEQTCRRRQELAERINDEETVRLAIQWAERHAQRAIILRRKVEVLQAELAMRREELALMDEQMQEAVTTVIGGTANGAAERAGIGGTGSGPVPKAAPPTGPDRPRNDAEFRRIDREARERAAEARLEELKKKMF